VQLRVKGRGVEVTEAIRSYAEKRLAKLERQVTRYREKRGRGRRPGRQAPDEGLQMPEEPQIVRTKQFAVKPMNAEEAVLQLELVGHDFFVFRDADSNEVNIVYRRRQGGYGLIEPQ